MNDVILLTHHTPHHRTYVYLVDFIPQSHFLYRLLLFTQLAENSVLNTTTVLKLKVIFLQTKITQRTIFKVLMT